MRVRTKMAGALVAVAAVAGSAGCDLPVQTAGAPCSKIGDYAQDGTYVMKCNDAGVWETGITVAVADQL